MEPLVSIVVITYNSSEFVIDALNSAREQSYKNIELIISDDASTDNTIDVCEKWLAANRNRFLRSEILSVPNNTGIPSNFNRGIVATTGTWIKAIAGDDALMPNCIQDNIQHVKHNPDIKVLYSYNRVYVNSFQPKYFKGLNPGHYPFNIITEEITASQQYKILLAGDRISFTPSLFFYKKALLDAGLPDEDLFSEHYQTILKFTKNGYKLFFMDKETTLYRQHEKSSNNMVKNYIIKPHYFKTEDFRRRYIYPYIPSEIRLSQQFGWFVNQIFRFDYFNRMTKFNKLLHYFLNVIINPFKYVIYFKSQLFSPSSEDVFYS